MGRTGMRMLACVLFGTALLMSAPLLNGYPLVFPDSGTYLNQALRLEGALDRPPFYSLFLLPLHGGITLWPVPVMQSVLAAFVVVRFLRLELPALGFGRIALVLAVATVATSLPLFTGKLMPDLFTPLILLVVWMLCFHWEALLRWERWALPVLLLGMVASHTASPPFAVALLAAALALGWRDRAGGRCAWLGRSLPLVLAPVLLAMLAQMLHGYLVIGRATTSPAGPQFLLARLIHDGPGRTYLAERCPGTGWAICDHLDALGADHNALLWNSDTAFALVTRRLGEHRALEEAAEIVGGTLRHHPLEVAGAALRNSLVQLVTFDSVDPFCPCAGGKILRVMEESFAHERDAFLAARQNTGPWPPAWLSRLHVAAAVAALAWLAVFALRAEGRQMRPLVLYLGFALAANAALMGALSGPDARYQARLIWLVPVVAVAALLSQHRAEASRPLAADLRAGA